MPTYPSSQHSSRMNIRIKQLCSLLSILIIAGCTAKPDPISTLQAPLLNHSTTAEQAPTSSTPAPPAPEPVPTISTNPEEEALWARLAQAEEESYVVLMRHALAPGTGDPTIFQLDNCSTQRNLSAEGQQQAIEIGETFRQRNIPVTKVLSSQWCRCLETAELMDIAPVEPFPSLNSFFRDRSTAETQTTAIKDYIAANKDESGVIIMVTHQVNITALSDVFPASGSAVVVQLEGEQLNILGQILEPNPS